MRSDLHGLLRGASEAIARARVQRALRSVDRVGARVSIVGTPSVENLGRMEIGDDVAVVSEPIRTHLVTSKSGRLSIGSRVSIGAGSGLTSQIEIVVEDDVEIGEGVNIMDTDFHDANDHRAGDSSPRPIRIKRGARLGDRVIVLKGSVIGENARVAAGSVVSGEIGDGESAGGVPARSIGASDGSGSVEARVLAAVARTFRVAEPSLDDGPTTLRGWDSLGSLRLLLAIEDTFSLVLSEKAVAKVESVRALAIEVAAQIARGREVAP